MSSTLNKIYKILIFFPLTISLITQATDSIIINIEPESGGYVIIQTPLDSKVEFLGKRFQVDSQGLLAIGFHRELSGKHTITIMPKNGKEEKIPIDIESREYNIQRIEGVPASRVTPPKSLTERIQAETQQVKKARAHYHNFDFWHTDDFAWPVKGRVTGVYGSQRYYNGKPGSPHWGIDLAAPKGSMVYAPAGGKVVLAEGDLYYSGGTIILDHGGALSSTFLHLSSLDVLHGQLVKKGDLIGKVGSTGRSTGPHLDWRMNLNGIRIDATLWVKDSQLK